MSVKGFIREEHFPTLSAALLYFDVSFMTWVLLGPLTLATLFCGWRFATTITHFYALRQAGIYSYRSTLFGARPERAA
jgi:nitrate/nitrite transporter NarK